MFKNFKKSNFVAWLRGWPQDGTVRAPEGYQLTYLPTAIGPGSWSQLKDCGLIRLADDYRSFHLRPAALPASWKVDEKIQSHGSGAILDEKNRQLAFIVLHRDRYNGKVRGGSIQVTMRYCAEYLNAGDHDVVGVVRDNDSKGLILFRSEEVRFPPHDAEAQRWAKDRCISAAERWLNENHPNWRHPAYGRN
jgi:hypothetical protein